tara:strand:+ start:2561 stop:3460 length:900 start_codon:yes stop_codon:yes gene_type:complete
MDWFRSHHGAPTDPKWLLIAKRAGVRPIHVAGTWWALLDHASQHSERGRVDDFDVETFALFAGMEEEHVSRIVTTLCDKGMIVDGRIAQWGKRQPKREDETATERKRRSRANKKENGGNPPTGGKSDTPDASDENDGHAMSRNVTPDKNRGDKSSSVTDVTGTIVPHPAADFCKAIFDSGVSLLTGTGIAERNARSLVGRLRQKLNDDPAMLVILREAETNQPSDPAAWLTAAVETRLGTRTRQPAIQQTSSGLRGPRPDPAIDLLRQARAEQAAGIGENEGGDSEAWPALPAYLTDRS